MNLDGFPSIRRVGVCIHPFVLNLDSVKVAQAPAAVTPKSGVGPSSRNADQVRRWVGKRVWRSNFLILRGPVTEMHAIGTLNMPSPRGVIKPCDVVRPTFGSGRRTPTAVGDRAGHVFLAVARVEIKRAATAENVGEKKQTAD
ncbi:hypothetical protein GW17_00050178 [Ensete ventricosum]|nr:hypothetical protein GW17_00050178 [Ensete ventricosum]